MARISVCLPNPPRSGNWPDVQREWQNYALRVNRAFEGLTDAGGPAAPSLYVSPAELTSALADYVTDTEFLAALDSLAIRTAKTNGEAFTIRAGQPVRISGSTVLLAQADAEGHQAHGIMLADTATGASGYVCLGGIVSAADWTTPTGGSATLTAGADYWTSQGAAGVLTDIGPDGPNGTVCQFLGVAISTTLFFAKIEQATIL